MTKLNDLLSQLNTAAHELKKQVVAIDCKILECQKQRDTLTSASVSKADFLDYFKSDIHKKYEKSYFLNELKRNLKRVSHEFGALEMGKNGGGMNIAYLTGDPVSRVPVTDDAVLFYFEDVILKGISSLLGSEEWPESAVPVEERKTLIVDLDAQIVALKRDRKKLTDQLLAAGLQG